MTKQNKNMYSKLIEGKEAERMFADENRGDIAPPIPLIGHYLLELRKVIFTNPFIDPGYYLLRHLYSREDRYLMDIVMLDLARRSRKRGDAISLRLRLRYKYYFLRYRRLLNKPPGEWSRITYTNEKPIYAPTAEVKAKNPNYGANKFRFWLPKPTRYLSEE